MRTNQEKQHDQQDQDQQTGAGIRHVLPLGATLFIADDWGGQSNVSPGVENWIGDISLTGAELAKKLEAHLRAYANDFVTIAMPERVTGLAKKDGGFSITTNKGSYEAKTVLIATGASRRKGAI